MNIDLKRACQTLAASDCTCVLCAGTRCHTSTQRGVAPLLQWLDGGTDLKGFSAADKVVGKAAAFLYCLLGVAAVHVRNMITPKALIQPDSSKVRKFLNFRDSFEGFFKKARSFPCFCYYST